MGEVADDMLDGSACSWCGMYFLGSSFGSQCICKDCFEQYRKENHLGRKSGQRVLRTKFGLQVCDIQT